MNEWKKKIYRDEREAKTMDRDRDRDLFAQLPIHLIQTILSLLITTNKIRIPSQRIIDTKEAARTIILSKTFLQAWSTFPDLYFSDLAFSKSLQCRPENATQASNARNARERFANYVLHTVTSYQNHNLPIKRLDLTAQLREDEGLSLRPSSIKEDGKIANILNQSICKANENGVKEVYLRMQLIGPSNFLQTIFSLKQLVSLILSYCNLVKNDVQDSDLFINCYSLRVLKLKHVTLSEVLLQKLMHSSPLIEGIKLDYCEGIQTIQIANLPYLKRLKVYTFRQRVNIESAHSLKVLKLIDVGITNAHFRSLIANCPVLEELTLANCYVLQKIDVSSHSLSLLSIEACRDLTEVKIDAPILNLFEYYGGSVLSPFSFANRGSGKKNSSVRLFFCEDEEVPSFLELSEFLMTFKHTDNVSLAFESTEISFDRNIMDELREESSIPEFDEVHIEVYSPSSTYSTIMEGLLWSFSPKVISLKHDSNGAGEFITYLCEELLVQHDDHPNISTSASDSWRNYFKQAKFKDNDRDDEWRPLHSWKNLANVLKNLGDHYILKLSRG